MIPSGRFILNLISSELFYFAGTLEVLSIPPLDLNQNNCEKTIENAAGDASAHVPPNANNLSPKLPHFSPAHGTPVIQPLLSESEDVTTAAHSDQSNSEDSSLSDSDRTLVGDAPDECLAQLSSTSNSPAGSEQHLSSPEEPHGVSNSIKFKFELFHQNIIDSGNKFYVNNKINNLLLGLSRS